MQAARTQGCTVLQAAKQRQGSANTQRLVLNVVVVTTAPSTEHCNHAHKMVADSIDERVAPRGELCNSQSIFSKQASTFSVKLHPVSLVRVRRSSLARRRCNMGLKIFSRENTTRIRKTAAILLARCTKCGFPKLRY